MKVKLNAFIYEHNLTMLSPRVLASEEKLIELCSFSFRIPQNGVPVGEIEVDLELVPADQIMQGMIAMLRNKQATIKQEARDQVAEIEVQVQNMLALPAPDLKGD